MNTSQTIQEKPQQPQVVVIRQAPPQSSSKYSWVFWLILFAIIIFGIIYVTKQMQQTVEDFNPFKRFFSIILEVLV